MPSPPTLGLEIISGCRSSYDQSYYHCNDAYDGITDGNGFVYNVPVPAWVIFEFAQVWTINSLTLINRQQVHQYSHKFIKFKVTLKNDNQWITPDYLITGDFF